METTLKFERVVLMNELNDKFRKVGEVFEVANVFEDSFLLRDAKSKVAIGVVSFDDFEKHFVKEEDARGWTKWQLFNGFNGQRDCMYRTNFKKIQVKFLTSNVRGEACCSREDDFNLSFGIKIAYLRALNKALNNRKEAIEETLNAIHCELEDNKNIIEKMINSLNA